MQMVLSFFSGHLSGHIQDLEWTKTSTANYGLPESTKVPLARRGSEALLRARLERHPVQTPDEI